MREGVAETDRFYAAQGGFSYSVEHVTNWVHENVQLPEAGHVLDLCCGDGIWSLGIAANGPRLTIHGLDISAGGIARAKTLVPKGHFLVADAERELPYREGSFEMIFARGPSLYNQHDMSRPATVALIASWHRLLTATGRLVSVFHSDPLKTGTYTPMDEAKLPMNHVPRRSEVMDFRGGKFHHTRESFRAPFELAADVEVLSDDFVRNKHILVTKRRDTMPTATDAEATTQG